MFEKIKAHHAGIAHLFGIGIGHTLQGLMEDVPRRLLGRKLGVTRKGKVGGGRVKQGLQASSKTDPYIGC